MGNDTEVRLFAEMARCMALDRNRSLDPRGALPAGTVLHGGWVSAIRNSNHALAALGLANDDGVLIVATPDFEASLSSQPNLDEAFVEQFAAFISIVAAQCGDLPTVREWFQPSERYIPVMSALCDNGYAAERRSRYLWLDRVALPMTQTWFWNADFEDVASIEAADAEVEVAHMLRTMPPDVRRALTKPNVIANFVNFGGTLARYWNFKSGSWRTEPVWPELWGRFHNRNIEPTLHAVLRNSSHVPRRR